MQEQHDPRILLAEVENHIRRAIRRIIVDEEQLPLEPVQRPRNPADHRPDALSFVEGRNDDRDGEVGTVLTCCVA